MGGNLYFLGHDGPSVATVLRSVRTACLLILEKSSLEVPSSGEVELLGTAYEPFNVTTSSL